MGQQKQKTRFITIEGAEGVGKSFFMEHLSKSLNRLGIRHITTREPGGTPVGESLRAIFSQPPKNEKLSIEAEFLMISAARSQHVQHKIIPALFQGNWVVCDRYVDSSRVYQGVLGGLSQTFIDMVSSQCTQSLQPEVTFLLDCDVDLSLARVAKRQMKATDVTRYDQASQSFHQQLRQAFLGLARVHQERICILNSALDINILIDQAIKHLKKRCFI